MTSKTPYPSINIRWARVPVVFVAFVTLCLAGCRTSDCDEETVNRAVAFIDGHQSCETDADCSIVHDFCEEIPGGWCGQLAMNRDGAGSAEWRAIQNELEDCAPEECTVCGGALTPTCHDGSCDSRRD